MSGERCSAHKPSSGLRWAIGANGRYSDVVCVKKGESLDAIVAASCGSCVVD